LVIFSGPAITVPQPGEEKMSTLPIRAPHLPQSLLPIPGFARVVSAVLTAIDVFTEAQRQAAAAHKRYPFADW
jgi:hypothetical protein